MKLKNEEMILDQEFRAMVIEEIDGDENQKRKQQMKKRYDIYKDNTKKYIWDMMKEESGDNQVLSDIRNRTSNINFARKIVNKKAMVYKDGVIREVVGNEELQEKTDILVDLLNFNSKMKKVNRYEELFKNASVAVLPHFNKITRKFTYKLNVYQPYLYDVIEDADDPEKALVYIFSYYNPSKGSQNYKEENQAGNREAHSNSTPNFNNGDGVDQTIADAPDDFGVNSREFVWWSHNYHFTTNSKGELIPGKQEDDLSNPIGMLPFYNFSKNQDGQFWAIGGEDVIDGSILLNVLLTDLFYIAKYQGMGIGYMFGKGVPKNMKVGPSSFISLDLEEGDPTPQLGFATSNPPIDAHLGMIEKYVAYLLTTNNLASSTVQGQLTPANAASGVHEMIKQAENMDDITDAQETYRDGEPIIFEIIKRWHNLYFEKGLLDNVLMQLGKLPDDFGLVTRFKEPQPFQTEMEKLDVIERRLTIGLDDLVAAIKRDNPELSEEDAQDKVKEKMKRDLLDNSKRLKNFKKPEENDQEDDIEKPDDME